MSKDKTLTVSQEDEGIPSVAKSEEKIAKDAPAAIKTLLNYGQGDLTEMLGLASHIRSGANK